MKFCVETVTPAVAAALLDASGGNRPIRRTNVEDIKSALRNGSWTTTHQAIAIDPEGRLLDGHHRCLAITETGISMTVPVARDVPPSGFDVMDIGRVRNASDALSLSVGKDVSHTVASVLRVIYCLERGHKPFTLRPSNRELVELATIHTCEDIKYSENYMRRPRVAGISNSGSVFIHYWLRRHEGDDDVDQFFSGALRGEGLYPGDPRAALRNRLMKMAIDRKTGGVQAAQERIALWIKAWNYWCRGREIRVLAWRANQEDFPEFELSGHGVGA